MNIIFEAETKSTRQLKSPKETQALINTLQTVFTFRWATVDQVALVLDKQVNTVQKQLNKLCEHRMLFPRPVVRSFTERGGSAKRLYRVARGGRDLLRRHCAIEDFSSVPPINMSADYAAHTISNHDVRAMAWRAATDLNFEVRQWLTDYDYRSLPKRDRETITTLLYPGKGKPKSVSVPIQPDQYLSIIVNGRRKDFFVEVDRGTEQLETFQRKIAGYVAYLKSGRFVERYGHDAFRMLTVVDTATDARRKALLTVTERQPKIANRFWYVNLCDLGVDAFFTHPIWTIAGSRETAQILPRVTAPIKTA